MSVCAGADCDNEAGTLRCPVCLKGDLNVSFCSQTCFKRNWSLHKQTHPSPESENSDGSYDPFPSQVYTGELRACYPLSPMRKVKDSVVLPDYAKHGRPLSEIRDMNGRSTQIKTLDKATIQKMREINLIAREVLDIAAAAVKPGVTTDEIDEIVHNACMERDAYPSPLNYYNFPKSVCTSVNEVVCHGIPDKYKLKDGDIVNIDISLYKDGVHSDLNETYYVGDKAKCDPDTVRLVETTRECLDLAIAAVKPGALIRSFGDIIEAHAKKNKCSVVRTYCGHGINQLFHCAPNVPHYAKNKAIGVCKPGLVFTIEPMICLGTYREKRWPDNWTSVTADGKWSAQFEHTLLVTDTGVEILTSRKATSPGGAVPRI